MNLGITRWFVIIVLCGFLWFWIFAGVYGIRAFGVNYFGWGGQEMTTLTLEDEVRAARDCLDLLPEAWWQEHEKVKEAHQHLVNALVKIKNGQVTAAAHLRSVIDDVFHDTGSRANP